MSCPTPKAPPTVEVRTFTVHPDGDCLDATTLGDKLHLEQEAHNLTRELLARAARTLEQLLPVAKSAQQLVALTTTCVRTPEQEAELQARLAAAVLDLSYVLAQLSPDVAAEVANG